MNGLKKAVEMLEAGGYTCVLCREDEVFTSVLRGVKPVAEWLASGKDFGGFFAADKVVGKATAYLYALLKVKAVYAGVISKGALAVLEKEGIYTEYGAVVENIINRSGDGVCPFESAVLDVNDKETAYEVIKNKMAELNI